VALCLDHGRRALPQPALLPLLYSTTLRRALATRALPFRLDTIITSQHSIAALCRTWRCVPKTHSLLAVKAIRCWGRQRRRTRGEDTARAASYTAYFLHSYYLANCFGLLDELRRNGVASDGTHAHAARQRGWPWFNTSPLLYVMIRKHPVSEVRGTAFSRACSFSCRHIGSTKRIDGTHSSPCLLPPNHLDIQRLLLSATWFSRHSRHRPATSIITALPDVAPRARRFAWPAFSVAAPGAPLEHAGDC